MGLVVAAVCTYASVYNIITPRPIVPGTGPNVPCLSNHSKNTTTYAHQLAAYGGGL